MACRMGGGTGPLWRPMGLHGSRRQNWAEAETKVEEEPSWGSCQGRRIESYRSQNRGAQEREQRKRKSAATTLDLYRRPEQSPVAEEK